MSTQSFNSAINISAKRTPKVNNEAAGTAVAASLPELWYPGTYDSQRQKLIPSLVELYNAAGNIVRAAVAKRCDATVLDLGAGTGLLANAVRASVPWCEIVLMDHSEPMLAKARERFDTDTHVSYILSEFTSLDSRHEYDAVVSALAIHHLEDLEKQSLFARIKNAIRPGGVFVNVEQVCAPRDDVEELYDEMHVAHVQRAGTTAEEWGAARNRMKFDKPAPMYSQLKWLENAGFQDVDCLYKNFRFATIVGWV